MVFVTADTNPPDAVTSKPEWVDNSDGKATLFWLPSSTQDVAKYRVYYGSTPDFADSQNASFAAQGVSPVEIPKNSSFTLSGLPNGTPTFVRVRAVDLAGNQGDWLPDAGTQPLQLQPNEVSPNEVGVLNLPLNQDRLHRMAVQGNALYVVATSQTCSSGSPSAVVLHTINLKELMSPVQAGRAQLTWNSPALASTLTFAETVACQSGESNADLIVDGSLLYVLTPTRVHLVSLAQPFAPVEVTPAPLLDLSTVDPGANFRAKSFALLGDKLAISGRSGSLGVGQFTTVYSLLDLYDRNPLTRPDNGNGSARR